jgi:hypothetical protein
MGRACARGLAGWALVLAFAAPNAGAGGPDASAAPSASTTTGVLCLRKLPGPVAFAQEGKGSSSLGAEAPRGGAAPRGAAPRARQRPRLSVRVDGGPTVSVDQRRGACVDGLARDRSHLVSVARDGRLLESARFDFVEEGRPTSALELHYDPFYGHVHVERLRRPRAGVTEGSCAVCPDAGEPRAPPTSR